MESEQAANMEMPEPSMISEQPQQSSEDSSAIGEASIVEATPVADKAAQLATDDPAEAEMYVGDTATAEDNADNNSVPEQAADNFEAEGSSIMGLQEEVDAGASAQTTEAPAAAEATAVTADQQAAAENVEQGEDHFQQEPAQTATVEAPVVAPSRLELAPSSEAAAPQRKGPSRPASSSHNVTQEPALAKADNAGQQQIEAVPEPPAAADAPKPTAAKPLSAKGAAAPTPAMCEQPVGPEPAEEQNQVRLCPHTVVN